MKQRPSARHPMAVVTRRTGLRADVIRAWERRHRAIRPARSNGNHRIYSDDDIRRLLLLQRALRAGWQIGQVASLDDDELERMIADTAAIGSGSQREAETEPEAVHLERCMASIEAMDTDGLRRELDMASVELGRVHVLDRLIPPLMHEVGQSSASGELRIAHEHLASAVIRSYLDTVHGAYHVSETAPAIIVTTPAFQHHELAAMLVAATARSEGWRAHYLGPNLPAEEIAAAVARLAVRAIALSVTHGADGPALERELRQLGKLLPDGVSLVVGGRAAGRYRQAIDEAGAERIDDMIEFRAFLAKLQEAT